jgi:TIR domain/Domain of unknown function (DUF4263)
MIQQLSIFCCYAYEDQAYLFDLKKYLRSLERQELIKLWDDTSIPAGGEVESAIYQHLNSAEIILLLVSPSFMASDECQKQMVRAMERQERYEAFVIPILLRTTNFQTAPFAKLKLLPTDEKPVVYSKRKNQDEAWYDVVQGIEKVVKDWHPSKEIVYINEAPKSDLGDELRLLIESRSIDAVHVFLAKHPDLLMHWFTGEGLQDGRIKTAVNLGKYRVPFVLGRYQPTIGSWEWVLVNLKDPDAYLFEATGEQSPVLSQALNEANVWRAWIQTNLSLARYEFPQIAPIPPVTILIGRRAVISEDEREALAILRFSMPGIKIHSYDSLLESV